MADLMYICGDVYTPTEIVAAERSILATVGYDVGRYTVPMAFVRRIVSTATLSSSSPSSSSLMRLEVTDVAVWAMASYFCELALVDIRCVGVPASLIAAGVVCVVYEILQRDWVTMREGGRGVSLRYCFKEKCFAHSYSYSSISF